jgi:hypothetical protein
MTFENWGFIYLGVGTEDPAVSRAVIETGGLRTTIVAVPERSATTVARVNEATGGRVPVGSVTYGMESVPGLATLFTPTM